jgi:signal transduction histidine kinase
MVNRDRLQLNFSHPLPFLRYLEWILLVIILIVQARLPPVAGSQDKWSFLNVACFLLFAGLGLSLPPPIRWYKFAYLGLELGIAIASALLGSWRLIALFFLIVIIRNCVIFRSSACAIANLITLPCCFVIQLYRLETLRVNSSDIEQYFGELFLILPTVSLILIGIFLQLLIQSFMSERQHRQDLAAAHLQLKAMATLQERNRIAREIHDTLGHALTTLNLSLEASDKLWLQDPDTAQTFLKDARELGNRALAEVRASVSTLRLDPLPAESLSASLLQLAREFQQLTGILPVCELSIPPIVTSDRQLAIYRIVQESLTNIAKHAQATEVSIKVRSHPHFCLQIEDNGCGFNPQLNTTGFGLQGIRERVADLKGTLEIKSSPGNGCKILVTLEGVRGEG